MLCAQTNRWSIVRSPLLTFFWLRFFANAPIASKPIAPAPCPTSLFGSHIDFENLADLQNLDSKYNLDGLVWISRFC